MKKQLLLSGMLFGCLSIASAQNLETENFNALTVGNVNDIIDGSTEGQGGFYFETTNGTAPTTSTNADASNAQIVDLGGEHQLVIQVEGADGDKGGRFLWKNGFGDAWAARTEGNDIVELEFDIYTGEASTSRNTFGVNVYNSSFQVLCGAAVRASTKELLLVAYSTPTGAPSANNYNYSLAAAPGIQLPAESWVRIGVSYNKTTGQVLIKAPGVAAAGVGVISSASGAGTEPAEIDILSGAGSATNNLNTSSAIMMFDNVVARASATDTLLGTDRLPSVAQLSVFPNPTSDVVNVVNNNNILVDGIQIVDLNGRTVKTAKFDGVTEAQVNISDLANGVYMMTVSSDKGTMTQKIVKN